MFTLLPVEEIDSVVREHERQSEHRLAQKLLAEEVTLMIHRSKNQPAVRLRTLTRSTEDGLEAARVATNVLFGTDYSDLRAQDIVKSLANDPRLVFCTEDQLLGITLPNLAANFGLTSSKCSSTFLLLH
jgi:tyrosyl-tRNA synthetase